MKALITEKRLYKCAIVVRRSVRGIREHLVLVGAYFILLKVITFSSCRNWTGKVRKESKFYYVPVSQSEAMYR